MRLSGMVFLIVGAIVALFSWYLSRQGQKMTLFLFVGAVMAVFGLWRLFVDREVPKENEERRRRQAEMLSQLPNPQGRHHHDIPRKCSNCGARNNPRANFCGHCGNRL